MRAVSLFNNACGEQIGEQIGGEQITVLLSNLRRQNKNMTKCFNPRHYAI